MREPVSDTEYRPPVRLLQTADFPTAKIPRAVSLCPVADTTWLTAGQPGLRSESTATAAASSAATVTATTAGALRSDGATAATAATAASRAKLGMSASAESFVRLLGAWAL